MLRAEATVVIDRPIEEVWSHVSDPRNELEYSHGAVEREVVTEGPIGKGTRVRGVDRFLGRRIEAEYEVTEIDPPTRLASRTVRGPFDARFTMMLETADGGTRVTAVGESPGLKGFFGKVADPVAVRIFRRQLETDLGTLKDLLESRS